MTDHDDPRPDPTDGGFDMGALLGQAMEMQQQLLSAQAAAAEAVVEGQAGGGAVRVRVTGAFEFQAVEISPSAVEADDLELLGDLVLAALRDAVDQLNELQQSSLGGLDLGALDVPGFDVAGLGGALGLGGDVIDVDGDDDLEPSEADGIALELEDLEQPGDDDR